tara:strand:- start:30 stop:407 length:378 start_codon:yes stop_codon:yes gene_type:complete
MEWHKKTEDQYESYMTVMAGGDNENEASLSEDEWFTITTVLSDFLDVITFEKTVEDLEAECYDDESVEQLEKVLKKIEKVDEFDASPIYVCELDLRRIESGKESVIEFIDRKKNEKARQEATTSN